MSDIISVLVNPEETDTINITVNPDGDEVTIAVDDSAGAAVFAAAAEASAIAAAAAASTAAADATALAEAAADDAEDAAAAAIIAQNAALTAASDAVAAVESAASDAAASVQAATAVNAQAAAASATQASGHKDTAAAQAAAASNSADRAATFVGGNWPLPHSHVTGPIAVDPTFTRLSDAYDDVLKRYAYNQRRWNQNGTLIEEGTTNLLPAGAENFVTGWTNGETITVTPNQPDPWGGFTAYRIQGNGVGASPIKYRIFVTSGLANPHSATLSVFAKNNNAYPVGISSGYMSGGYSMILAEWSRVIKSQTIVNSIYESIDFVTTASATNSIDITVCCPQVEAKPYATSYTPPGTTRAAESLTIPVGAYQKNLLTPNQATGGDTLGNTTGFSAVGATITRDTTVAWSGTGSIKAVTNNAAAGEGISLSQTSVTVIGKIYTHTAYVSGSGTVKISDAGIGGSGGDVVLTATPQRLTFTFVATTTTTHSPFIRTSTQQAATFYIDGLQLEEGTTASDWALPSVDYSNAVLNPTAGTIEFDFIWDGNITTQASLFCFVNPDNSYLNLYIRPSDNYLIAYTNNVTLGSYSFDVITPHTKYSIKFRWSGVNMRGSLSGVLLTNSVQFKSFTRPEKLLLGTFANGGYSSNSSISNLRISNIARTDTEMQYTGKLLPDEFTTFCSDMKESISSRPFVKDSLGQAQNVLIASDSPNQNAIINGDFRLASRGTSFTNPASGATNLDMWRYDYNGTGQTFVISQESMTIGSQEITGAEKFLRINQTVAPTGQTNSHLGTRIEDVKTFNGRKCTNYLWLRSSTNANITIQCYQYFGSGGSASVYPTIAYPLYVPTKWTKFQFPLSLPSVAGKTLTTNTMINYQIYLPYNITFQLDIADVELKPADAPTSFYRRDLQILQQLRNRYLQTLPANLQLRAVNVTANTIDFESVMLPTEMRATPALAATYAETTNWKVLSTAGVQTTGFTWALLNASANQVAFRATKTAHGLTDATLQLVTNVLLSAEL